MDIESAARIRYNEGCARNVYAEHAEYLTRAKPSVIISTFFCLLNVVWLKHAAARRC